METGDLIAMLIFVAVALGFIAYCALVLWKDEDEDGDLPSEDQLDRWEREVAEARAELRRQGLLRQDA